ncbi:MAG: hypothetical protein E3K32_04090 [wastewater metagenome]|nr:hypothetical protein [Candidatus Loosdrechtia aerotolerans]
MMDISHENRLLLYCAQNGMPEDTLNEVKDIMSLSLNWEEVLASAFWHGIAPLLYHNLKHISKNYYVPQEVMAQLRTAYQGNLARNMYLYAELKRSLEAFYDKGVKVIVLKGAALAKIVYDDIGLRQMSDIDLLVKQEDLSHAEKIMSGLGYYFHGNMPPEWYRENHQHISYIHPETNIPVEIHWHIAKKTHMSRIRIVDTDIIEEWWEGVKTLEFCSNKAFILCPDDLIIHLCLHFFKHRFISQNRGFTSKGALIQMCDIFQTLKYYRHEIDWVRLKGKAEQYGIDTLMYTTLFIVKEIMGEHDDIFHNILWRFRSEDLDHELVQLIKKRLLNKEDALTIIPNTLIRSRVAHTFQEKIKILLRGTFPNPEIISKKYSIPLTAKMLYFYYVIYPFHLLLKYRKTMFEMSRTREEAVLNTWINSQDNT